MQKYDEKLREIAEAWGWTRARKSPNLLVWEIEPDSRSEIPEGYLIRILKSLDPMERYQDLINDTFYEDACDIENELVSEILRKCPDLENMEDGVRDWVSENCAVLYPYDHFLEQDVCVNIMVDTGDGNWDYALNKTYPAYLEDTGSPINDRAAIVWLARQQGYTKTALRKALRKQEYGQSKFLKSMLDEVANIATSMNILTFFVRMTLREAMQLQRLIKLRDRNGYQVDNTKNPYSGYIVLDKDAGCGLLDPWNGGGSTNLEIILEKDVKLPVKFIRSALPDGGDGFSVTGIYGFGEDFWPTECLKEIHFPKQFKTMAAR